MTKIRPLSPELWFDRLGRLNHRLSTELIEIEQALRQAFHLSLLAPGPFADILANSCDEKSFERLLEIEHYDEAIELLVKSEVFDISINVPDGHAVARIASALFNLKVEVVARDKVTASLTAWIEIILGLEKAALDQEINLTGPAQRRVRSERRRLSTRH